jgi:Flagellar hook-length control protein FliK
MSSIVVSPLVPLLAVQGATADVVLQPGTVINAQVLQLLGNDQVQISIGGQKLDVVSQVPLQAGQSLQLAVSQAADGNINLAVVNQPAGVSAGQSAANPATVNYTSDALAAAATGTIAPANATAPQSQLTGLQALAVSVAAETAAVQQASLAPLFANLAVAATSDSLPQLVQQAAAGVLAQRTSLDPGLTGADIKEAFQGSGLFLEASLAQGSVSSSTPDLKAALIVLRQVLTSAIDDTPVTATTTSSTSTATLVPSDGQATTAAATPATTAPVTAASPTIVLEQGADTLLQAMPDGSQIAASVVITASDAPDAASPSLAPLLTSEAFVSAASRQGVAPEVAQSVLEFSTAASPFASAPAPTDAAARAAASSAALNLLQEAVQAGPLASPLAAANASRLGFDTSLMLSLLPVAAGIRVQPAEDGEFIRTNVPPPPISGALPAAQPVAPATLVSSAPLETAMHHLLADTDGAIARQTLLQVASLPDQVDPSTGRIDPTAQRWNFEIPFLTPQGTAMAQFQISRDGAGSDPESAATKTWRARFTLDVEPAGPVHALVSLNGDKTSVRMWAERPATANQLRAGVTLLSQALSRAELQPGDIVVRDGVPPQPAAPKAGHFLDRAL